MQKNKAIRVAGQGFSNCFMLTSSFTATISMSAVSAQVFCKGSAKLAANHTCGVQPRWVTDEVTVTDEATDEVTGDSPVHQLVRSRVHHHGDQLASPLARPRFHCLVSRLHQPLPLDRV